MASDLLKLIVEKGFIAVDGTSLTVCDVNTEESWFNFMLVQVCALLVAFFFD